MKGVRCVKEAPRQGWLLQLRDGRLTGIAGSGVKGGDDWLFEGGWAHTDSPRSLSPSGVYLGSGAVWDGKTLSLIAPSHTADAVYVLERPDELMASNSLPFLLAASGTYDFPIRRLTGTMLSLKRGIRSHKRCIYSGRQGKFYRFFNAIVTHTPDAGLQERLQVAEADFDSFESYRAYLVSTIRQASDTYGSQGIAVHVSRGYNSVACAAIAASLGKGGTALCVERSRWGDPDDGTEVARMLGLDPVLLPRRDRQKVSGDYHAGEYVSANDVRDLYEFYLGMGVTDACLKAPEEVLAGRTLLTGFHGDDIWAPSMSAFPDLVRDSADGSSLGEFRLRVGYLHVPVPMLGFRRAVWLRGLSLSEEMRPWRLNRGYYDRPIPRRIAEEAGVPRELFGQVKHAAAMIAVNLSTIASEMFRALIADYEPAARAFEAKAGRRRSWLRLPGGAWHAGRPDVGRSSAAGLGGEAAQGPAHRGCRHRREEGAGLAVRGGLGAGEIAALALARRGLSRLGRGLGRAHPLAHRAEPQRRRDLHADAAGRDLCVELARLRARERRHFRRAARRAFEAAAVA